MNLKSSYFYIYFRIFKLEQFDLDNNLMKKSNTNCF